MNLVTRGLGGRGNLVTGGLGGERRPAAFRPRGRFTDDLERLARRLRDERDLFDLVSMWLGANRWR